MSSQQLIGEAYPSITPDLKRLCAIHHVDPAWIDESEDCVELLARVSEEFERLLNLGPVDGYRRRLQGLIHFSTEAASLHEKAASSVAIRRRLEELERENRELRSAVSGGDGAPLESGDLRRTERLDDMFKTLSSLSHQINNPLTSLLGRTQLLRMSGAADDRTTKAMSVIEESATRVARYVRELALVVKECRERELGHD